MKFICFAAALLSVVVQDHSALAIGLKQHDGGIDDDAMLQCQTF